MPALDPAVATQVANLQQRCGKTMPELFAVLQASGLDKHGALRDLLKREHGLGHGDANLVVHLFLQDRAPTPPADAATDVLAGIYTGPKAALRPIHEAVMAVATALGPFEVAPKKTYISLRRAKQFAMVGPATKTQVEVGFNAKTLAGSERLVAVPPGGMCAFTVRLDRVTDVDAEFADWMRRAFEAAG